MKKIKCCVSMVLVCVLFVAISSTAAARASAQIDYYSIDATTVSDGRLAIKFSVTGANIMKRLGAESIYIYERTGYGWQLIDSFDKDDSGMTGTNAIRYSNVVYYDGEAGRDYRVVVTIFAEDKYGESDSRTKTITLLAQ